MGRIAAELADELVVTDDNPRSEPPERIVADILAGIPAAAMARVEHDRALAIRATLARSGPEDVVLIAGKGHEDYQIYGSERRRSATRRGARRARGDAGHERQVDSRANARKFCATLWRAARRRRSCLYRRLDRHAHARRALCSSPCAAQLQWQRIRRRRDRRRRRRGAGRRAAAGCAWRRSSSPIRKRRSSAPDTLGARQFDIPVVGVAGSNGKTTAKEMTAAILGQAGNCSCDARQSQQPHRRAADACCGSRPDTASRSSRWAPTGREKSRTWSSRAADGRPDHQRGRGASRGLRQPRGRGARGGRDGRGSRGRCHGGDQRGR